MKKQVLIMFGGVSAEHEVSIISGLQVVENIDRELYEPHVVYITKTGEIQYYGILNSRKDFVSTKPQHRLFGKNALGGVVSGGLFRKKVYPVAAFLAFHGGNGESGQAQGLLEVCGIPHTGASTEGAVIAMNKQLTKQVLSNAGVITVKGVSLFSKDILNDSQHAVEKIITQVGLPVITKPVHLGSSIGITIARDVLQLEKALIEAAHVDSEILIEELLTDFVELNASVRMHKGTVQVSQIERPVSKDEILSFADKYQRGGGKKSGKQSGMASLDREIPAKITPELRKRIEETARKAYAACRLQGAPRIDFMYKKATDELFLTEINPIPGSLAFYLWEASGTPFKQQITDAIEECIQEYKESVGRQLDYKTDIVETFCS